MKYLQLILPFITGLMLGIAQYTSRLFLLKRNLAEGFLFGGITATLYLIAIVQWSKILKSQASISSSYAIVVLGVFSGMLIINSLKIQEGGDISAQDIIGFALIAAGSALIKH